MTIEWREIKGYEGKYMVSRCGKIYSLINDKELILGTSKGYKQIDLCKNGKITKHRVHRLVAQAFIPNPFHYPQINHKDGNKSNNHVDNLEWCTAKHNSAHARKTGLQKIKGFKRQPGESNGFSKLTEDKVLEMRKMYADGGYTLKELGSIFDCHYSTVGYIIQRKRWNHI